MTTIQIEVKNTLHICITSGIKGPEIELTDEEVSKTHELVDQLNTPWEDSNFFGTGLSSDHFLVSIVTPEYYCHLDINILGYVKFCKVEAGTEFSFDLEKEYKDTAGLWGYLAPIAHRAYLQWLDEQKRYSLDYAVKAAQGVPGYIVFGLENEKVPGTSE